MTNDEQLTKALQELEHNKDHPPVNLALDDFVFPIEITKFIEETHNYLEETQSVSIGTYSK